MSNRLKIIKELEKFENDNPNIKRLNQELKNQIKNSNLDEEFKPTAEAMNLATDIIGMLGYKNINDKSQLYLMQRMLESMMSTIKQHIIVCLYKEKKEEA